MGIERESAVKKAEELVREGKVDLAIEEYLRLVDDQPGDVGAANALGDLYVKAGNRAAAVAQFVQIGDNHRHSGFVPKAVAFYKKALKVDPASDHALSQLAQIAVEQELYADATLYLNRLLQRRREQNDEAGVADCLVRIGSFPTATADAKLAAARASAGHLPQDQAARRWVDAADALERAGRSDEAMDALMQAAGLEPDDMALRRRVTLACAATGQIDRARGFLSFDTAGDHPDLLLALAEHALAEGRDEEARRALQRVIDVAPARRIEAEAMLETLVAGSEPAPSAQQIPADFFTVAAEGSGEGHISLDVDAPLDVAAAFGAGSDAAESAEAVSAEPDWASLLGSADDADPDDTPEPVGIEEYGEVDVAEAALDAASPDEPAAVAFAVIEPATRPGMVEPAPASQAEPEPEPEQEPEPEPESELESEPESVPPSASQRDTPIPAEAAGDVDVDSIAALTAAAQNPALQFQASAQLGRLFLRAGRDREGIEWLERASQAATSVREQRLDVMYELADALERAGERARALDVFADLDFDAASYRDVPERIALLRQSLGEGRAP